MSIRGEKEGFELGPPKSLGPRADIAEIRDTFCDEASGQAA